MISEGYFDIHLRMLETGDACSRRLAHDELLHWYKENEAAYYKLLRKPVRDWDDKQSTFVQRMEQIKNTLEL